MPLLALLPALGVLVFLLLHPPFFGLMDDAGLLQMATRMSTVGTWRIAREFVGNDLSTWGMFRPLYPLLAGGMYGITGDDPRILFLLNFACVVGIIWLVAQAFVSALPIAERDRRAARAALLLGCFAFPWFHDAFVHPSLQEKWVLLAGAINLAWFSSCRLAGRDGLYLLASAGILALGFSTKAQFVIFVPVVLALVLARSAPSDRVLRAGAVAAIAVAMTAIIRQIAIGGAYTAKFGAANIPTNLANPKAWALLALAGAWTMAVARVRRRDPWPQQLLWATPSLLVLSFLAVFLQWTLAGYLLSLVAIAPAAMAAAGIAWLPSPSSRRAAFGLLLVVALGVTAWRTSGLLRSLGDLGTFIRSDIPARLAERHDSIILSCDEGAPALAYYLGRFRGLTIDVRADARGLDHPAVSLGDSRLCPIRGDLAGHERIWSTGHPGSFELWR